MKPPRACRQCRESKRKCKRLGPGEPCDSCQLRSLRCGGELQTHVMHSTTGPTSKISEKEESRQSRREHERKGPAGLSWETAVELVEYYLEKLHSSAISQGLLCALCAIGSKFSPNSERRQWEIRLTADAKRLLQADLENVCVENIQTCILVAMLSAANCQISSEALFIRIATSMVEILKLDSATRNGSIVVRETARRIWWSLYIADHWCSSGFGIPHCIEGLGRSWDLPMDDFNFRSLSPNQTVYDISWKPGLWAHIVTLVRLSSPIQDLNRSIARGNADPVKVCQIFRRIEEQLKAWVGMLPIDIQMSVQNLDTQIQKGSGGTFIALHLAYHHYSTLLYFRFLEFQQTLPTTGRTYVSHCKHHASSFSGLLHRSRQMKETEVSYPAIGHMTTVSSSVLVHTLLFGDLEEIKKARQELNMNYEALIDLQNCWPTVSAMINRLMTFQNLCILSIGSHRLDGWMVRFLLEHSLALEEKELTDTQEKSEVDSGNISSKAKELTELGRYTNFEIV